MTKRSKSDLDEYSGEMTGQKLTVQKIDARSGSLLCPFKVVF